MTVIVPILIIGILIVLNGIFVAAEFAIVSVPKARISNLAEKGSKAAQNTLKTITDPDKQNRYFTTAQVGITIVSLALGMYGEQVIAEWLINSLENSIKMSESSIHLIASILSVSILTYLHVVLGEMIPKSLALQASTKLVLLLNRPMAILEKLLTPLVIPLTAIGNWVTEKIGMTDPENDSNSITAEDLEFIIEESSDQGLLSENDLLFVENILDLDERIVAQAMTPRNHIVAVSVLSNREELMEIICSSTKTRYPIYDDDLDQIIGILHIKDIARHQAENENQSTDFDLKQIARSALFVPESLPLIEMLSRFQKGQYQIAIAFDEFGGTSGLLTLEDLVEEVVGEIQDEFDEETLPIEEISKTKILVRGDVILEELNQHYDLGWQHPEANSIGGLIMILLGRLPNAGDKMEFEGVIIEVIEIEGYAVKKASLKFSKEFK